MKTKKKTKHYVNNAEFSQAVHDYVLELREAEKNEEPLPTVPNYIAECFIKIAEGLSHNKNFIRYTYREEMVMDAVENSLKAIRNYDIDAATRTGKPNAFAYFTQISYYAFLRRIQKEKKQQDTKMKYIAQSGIETEALAHFDRPDIFQSSTVLNFMDTLRNRIDAVKTNDALIEDYVKLEKAREKSTRGSRVADSNLGDFIDDE